MKVDPSQSRAPRNYEAFAGHVVRRMIPCALRMILLERGLWGDIRQEVKAVAFECEKAQLNMVEAKRYIQRRIYRALRDMGLRRRGPGYYFVEEGDKDGGKV